MIIKLNMCTKIICVPVYILTCVHPLLLKQCTIKLRLVVNLIRFDVSALREFGTKSNLT